MHDETTTLRNLLKDQRGRGCSEHMLTNILRDVLNEIAQMHGSNKSHGHISLDTLMYNRQTRRASLKPPLVLGEADQAEVSKDIADLGCAIVALLTFNSNKDPNNLIQGSRWKEYCFVSDQFAMVLTRSLSNVPGTRYGSVLEMLHDLTTEDSAFVSQALAAAPSQSDQDRRLLPLDKSQAYKTMLVTSRWQRLSRIPYLKASMLSGAILSAVALIVGTIKLKTKIEAPLSPKLPALSPSQQTNDKQKHQIEDAPNNSPTYNQVRLRGIDLPITNKMCNKRGTFCIYNLATMILEKSGEAQYSFSEMQSDQLVEISGTIQIAKTNVFYGDNSLSFSFRDDQKATTPGWAAAGLFSIGQDELKPGIRTVFKTTESFGSKTPVGLENIAFLFPK
jgi:hypothetical protein